MGEQEVAPKQAEGASDGTLSLSKDEVVSFFTSHPSFNMDTSPLSWGGGGHEVKQPPMTQEEDDLVKAKGQGQTGVYMWKVVVIHNQSFMRASPQALP